MRFHRDQYLDLMTFRGADRPMFVELFGPLIGLEDEWIAQGAGPDELTLVSCAVASMSTSASRPNI